MNIGPQLPDGWDLKSGREEEDSNREKELGEGGKESGEQFELPDPSLNEKEETPGSSSEEEDDIPDGPVIGASMPPDLLAHQIPSISSDPAVEDSYGPALPPDLLPDEPSSHNADPDEESDEDEIGPQLPTASGDPQESYQYKLALLKQREAAEKDKKKREDWMTELPSSLKSYGLGARSFSKRTDDAVDTDTSAWTDTPQEKAAKSAMGITKATNSETDLKKRALQERDAELEEKSKTLNKDREGSLVETHMKKRKMDSDDGPQPGERVPFSRDTDLGPCPLSGQGMKSVMERAAQLGNRFSHGSQQKFL